MVIAVNFDGTITEENSYPNIGIIRTSFVDWLKERQKLGYKLILWTCRTGNALLDAIHACEDHHLMFDAVNENLYEKYVDKNISRKIIADLYIDDRAQNIEDIVQKIK